MPQSRLRGPGLLTLPAPRAGRIALATLALGASAWVIVWPFFQARHPPMADFPFHAAHISILRHFFDDTFHFRDQFTFRPFDVPYLSMWTIGAALATVVSIEWAAKLAAIVMLALLPVGLAVLFHGMKKSPLFGVLALGLVWTPLTHWGFLPFVGAIGLTAMAVGLALRALDEPSRRAQAWLTGALVAVFVTHVSRMPFALLAVAATAVIMFPATRRVRPVLVPLAIGAALLVVWRVLGASAVSTSGLTLRWYPERIHSLGVDLLGGFNERSPLAATEVSLARFFGVTVAVLAAASTALLFIERRHRTEQGHARARAWLVGVTVLPLVIAGGFALAYVTLPESVGAWWYVNQREIVCAAFFALAAIPDLPERLLVRAAAVTAVGVAAGRMSAFVAEEWRRFDGETRDFDAIVEELPPAPKLFYLVYDHRASNLRVMPFTHLPAWVQAKQGGWLGFHHASFRSSPIQYRPPEDADDPPRVVPPEPPERFEWTPQHFRVLEHGPFFDWFLVRHYVSPEPVLRDDPALELVARRGKWWLWRRSAR